MCLTNKCLCKFKRQTHFIPFNRLHWNRNTKMMLCLCLFKVLLSEMQLLLLWTILSHLVITTFSWSFYHTNSDDDLFNLRYRDKREVDNGPETTTEDLGTAPPIESGEPIGPSLGDILSKFSLVVMVIYVLGIGWKLIKIYKGDYEREEPIYLKYK